MIGNEAKEQKNINPIRLQAFDVLNELLIELPSTEDSVFSTFHTELIFYDISYI